MDINRNQVFTAGLLFLLLGIEFLCVDTFILTPDATRLLAEQTDHPVAAATNGIDATLGTQTQLPPSPIRPPIWLGWCLTSIGSVLVLHALSMPKPG